MTPIILAWQPVEKHDSSMVDPLTVSQSHFSKSDSWPGVQRCDSRQSLKHFHKPPFHFSHSYFCRFAFAQMSAFKERLSEGIGCFQQFYNSLCQDWREINRVLGERCAHQQEEAMMCKLKLWMKSKILKKYFKTNFILKCDGHEEILNLVMDAITPVPKCLIGIRKMRII